MAEKPMRKVILSGMIGNTLEWYDYALYGHFAAIISKLFFPSSNEYLSLIAAFGVFAAGFIMRPVGAVIFGYIGDRYGRRTSLTASIILMAIATGCLSILPTYEAIGIAAPILLTVIRLVQGISLGGEFSGSMVFMAEYSKDKHKSVVASLCLFSACIGILLGSFVGTFFAQVLPEGKFEQWGWRIPFMVGVAIGIVGLYIRYHIGESPLYKEAKESGALSSRPVRHTFQKHWPALLIGVGIYLTVTVPFYTLSVFINSFMVKILGHPIGEALFMNTLGMLAMTICIPLSALLSNKYGRKKILVWSGFAVLVMTYPCFMLLTQPGFAMPLLGQILFAIPVGFFLGPVPIVLVELFPTAVRYTGMSLAYNFAAALFGGTTPIVAVWLIKTTGDLTAPGLYVMACAVISLITLAFFKETYKKR